MSRRLRGKGSLADVVSVRIETLESTSWVAWREIEILSDQPTGQACLGEGPLYRAPSTGAAVVAGTGNLTVLAEARLESDGEWLRVPGDRWIQAATTDCPSLPLVAGPTLDLVEVTIEVQLPPGSGEVFSPGLYGAGIPQWDPYVVLMLPTEENTRSVKMLLSIGETVEYRYTQAGLEIEERSDSCGSLGSRSFTVSAGLVVQDVVANWSNEC